MAVPIHGSQQAQVELGPRRRHDGAALILHERAPFDTDGMVRLQTHESERHVHERRSKHGRRRLNVRAPTAVDLLVCHNVRYHEVNGIFAEHVRRLAHAIPDDNKTGQ